MRKLYSATSVFILAICMTVNGWAADACKPIALACMAEGYYKGGGGVGKDLVRNCVMPVVAKKKTLLNDSFSDADLQQCKSSLNGEKSIPL